MRSNLHLLTRLPLLLALFVPSDVPIPPTSAGWPPKPRVKKRKAESDESDEPAEDVDDDIDDDDDDDAADEDYTEAQNGPSFAKRSGPRASRVEILTLLLNDYERCKQLFGMAKLNRSQLAKVLVTQRDVVGQSKRSDRLADSISSALTGAIGKGLPAHWMTHEESGKILFQLRERD